MYTNLNLEKDKNSWNKKKSLLFSRNPPFSQKCTLRVYVNINKDIQTKHIPRTDKNAAYSLKKFYCSHSVNKLVEKYTEIKLINWGKYEGVFRRYSIINCR